MRKWLPILAASLAVFACSRVDGNLVVDKPPRLPDTDKWKEAVEYVYDITAVPEIHVYVQDTEWEKLLAAYDANHDTQEYVMCNVQYTKNGETVLKDSVGLRLKGNTSRRRPQEGTKFKHCHYGLNFKEITGKNEERSIHGIYRFDLKWFKDDPACVRELFCYDLFRRFGVWTSPYDTYCRLWMHAGRFGNAYLGVYGQLEHVGKDYLRIREKEFGGRDGNLWKCAWGSSLRYASGMGADDNEHGYTYTLKTNLDSGFVAAKAQLTDFITKVSKLRNDAFYNWIGGVMDMDLFLRTYAVNVAVGMWDDYWNNTNNYYLYFNNSDPTQYKVFFIPYDYDNTLGTTSNCGVQSDAGRQDPLNWGSPDNPLMTKILSNPEWKEKYIGYLKELCAGEMEAGTAMARIKDFQALVSDYVSNDTGQDMTISDRPASWSSHGEYRIMTGGPGNFFTVKAGVVAALK